MKDYAYYLDKAKEVQGFKYDKQIDQALGFKGAMACMLSKNKNTISEEKMIELAKLGNQNHLIALIDHKIMATNGVTNNAYTSMRKTLSKSLQTLCAVALVGMASMPSEAQAKINESGNIHNNSDIIYYHII